MELFKPPPIVKNSKRELRDQLIGATARDSHIWARDPHDWYVEDYWCSRRLFAEEPFRGEIYDPNCGWGRVLRSAKDAGYAVRGSDIVIRPSGDAEIDAVKRQADFRDCVDPADNIVSNPASRWQWPDARSRSSTRSRDSMRPSGSRMHRSAASG